MPLALIGIPFDWLIGVLAYNAYPSTLFLRWRGPGVGSELLCILQLLCVDFDPGLEKTFFFVCGPPNLWPGSRVRTPSTWDRPHVAPCQ